MTETAAIAHADFRRILTRNVGLPLLAGIAGAVVFLALILYLLAAFESVDRTERVIGNAGEVGKLAVDLETGMRGYLLTGEEAFLAPYEIARPRVAAQLATLRELVADKPAQLDRLRRIEALQGEWDRFAQSAIDARRHHGAFEEAVRSGRGKVLTDEFRRELAEFTDAEQRLRQQRSNEAHQTTVGGVTLFVLFTLGLSALLAWSGRREVVRLSSTYDDALGQTRAQAASLEHEAWLREGQSLIAAEMVGKFSPVELGAAALEFLARRLDVVVAALYACDPDGTLRRVAAYGFSREAASAVQAIGRGEGLVGQAALERRTIVVLEAPPAYLKISSGLGEGPPKNVAVVPLDHEGNVNGVLELGFARPLDTRDTEFMRLIAGTLGAALDAVANRQRLQNFLTETQQLNEELQVQQEELRTANEELEEQSRLLKESQASLENQQAELEQSNEHLAEQTLALDQRNTMLLQARSDLQQRADELQKASRYKSEFLANMSHELRTPLNSSLILARLLADNAPGNLNAEQVRFAESIHGAGNDLLNLINDILDISKVEAGKLELHPEDVSLEQLVGTLRTVFEPLAAEKHLAFEVEIDPATPPTLYTDRLRVEQILKNLLSNAIKFTDAGRVTLALRGRSDGGADFAVRDSGIGIADEQQQAIFEAFRQADGTTSRRYGGTGLGLSISRDLTRLLGGALELRSAPGEGSVFTLTLPARWTPAAAAPAASDAPARRAAPSAPIAAPTFARPVDGPVPAAPRRAPPFTDDRTRVAGGEKTVLVIEDDPRFAGILYDLAHERGYRCLVAQGAEEGLDLAAREVPDAVLLDFGLPDRPGLAVLHQLKDDPRTRHIPVHVVSAEDRSEAAMQMGAIGYAVKPTTREELKAVFQKLEERFAQRVKRVLLVEDDARQRESVVALIGDDDIQIDAVERGEEALAKLRVTGYDCMIIDLKLPDMQGSELLRRMSSEDIFSFPPVVVYTGRNLTRDEEAELLKYSRAIIIKGARSPERLLDEVTLFLHQVESRLTKERQSMLKTARSREKVFEGRRVLLVDDDVRNIFALTSALEQKGIAVEIARNGVEAIEKLEQVDAVDLVLMDVMMPVMDGLEATRRIRKVPRLQKLPIVAVTAKAMKDDQAQCLKAGANDYLAKPIDLDRLLSLLRVWMPAMERI